MYTHAYMSQDVCLDLVSVSMSSCSHDMSVTIVAATTEAPWVISPTSNTIQGIRQIHHLDFWGRCLAHMPQRPTCLVCQDSPELIQGRMQLARLFSCHEECSTLRPETLRNTVCLQG